MIENTLNTSIFSSHYVSYCNLICSTPLGYIETIKVYNYATEIGRFHNYLAPLRIFCYKIKLLLPQARIMLFKIRIV